MLNPVALVTGATRGIGRSISLLLAKEGYNLFLLARDKDALTSFAKEISSRYRVTVKFVALDLTHTQELQKVVTDTLVELGGQLNVLVHNAGLVGAALTQTAEPELIEEIVGTNFTSNIHLTRVALPFMVADTRENKAIIFISSTASHALGVAGMATYFGTKEAQRGFARGLWTEVKRFGIKVSVICPGIVDTSLGHGLTSDFSSLYDASRLSLKPDHVAEAIQYVLKSSPSVCPVEIVLQPAKLQGFQKDEWTSLKKVDTTLPVPITDLKKKVALITGASGGIGRGIAVKLAENGWNLALNGRNEKDLQATATACEKFGVKTVTIIADVAKLENTKTVVHECVKKLGNLGLLVCNAGINRRRHIGSADPQVWDQIIQTNALSAMHMIRHAVPYLIATKGNVIQVGSTHSYFMTAGQPGGYAYVVSKWAQHAFSNCLNFDLSEYGVKSTLIGASLVETKLGSAPGPVKFLNTDKFIQTSDIGDACLYALNSGEGCVPSHIFMYPQAEIYPHTQQNTDEWYAKLHAQPAKL